jgi:acyl-coenzyme A thioesterase PaaI-like protein
VQQGAVFTKLVGPIWMREMDSELRLGLLVEKKHLNRAGNVHGGMLMTFADQAMALWKILENS